jgi:hypothetical protein
MGKGRNAISKLLVLHRHLCTWRWWSWVQLVQPSSHWLMALSPAAAAGANAKLWDGESLPHNILRLLQLAGVGCSLAGPLPADPLPHAAPQFKSHWSSKHDNLPLPEESTFQK